jgi:hypothetical protein
MHGRGLRALIPSGIAALALFDICLQDDVSRNFLLVDSSTGASEIHVCQGAVGCGTAPVVLSGVGTITVSGDKTKLVDKTDDRKVSATIDFDKRKGSAIGTYVHGNKLKVKIKDTDISDDTCACP